MIRIKSLETKITESYRIKVFYDWIFAQQNADKHCQMFY